MLAGRGRISLPASLLLLCSVLFSPASARAADGLYLRLGAGYGTWDGQELVTREVSDGVFSSGEGCCPSGTLTLGGRFGYALFGSVALEGIAFGSGWNLGDSDESGSIFAGGGLRLYPLGLLRQLSLMSDDVLPIDLSLGAGFGYALTGSNDFAYEGTAFGTDIALEWMPTDWIGIGAALELWFPDYEAFAYTSYSGNRGVCLGANARPTEAGVISHDQAAVACPSAGRGPSTTVVSPQLYMTFHFGLPLSR